MAKRAKNIRRIRTTAQPAIVAPEPLRVVFERPAYGLVGRILLDTGIALTGVANRVDDADHRALGWYARRLSVMLDNLGDAYYRRAGTLWNGDVANARTPMFRAEANAG